MSRERRTTILKKTHIFTLLTVSIVSWMAPPVFPQGGPQTSSDILAGYRILRSGAPGEAAVGTTGQFNGYTNYWHDIFWEWRQYANLFQISLPRVSQTIRQNKLDTAEELGLPGLLLEEGFLDGLLNSPFKELDNPSISDLEKAMSRSNLLLFVDPASGLGRRILPKIPPDADWRRDLESHQLKSAGLENVHAVVLENGERKLFVVLSKSLAARARFRDLIHTVRDVLAAHDLHRGWFGTGTLLHSVTCFPGHPLEVIGEGLNQGNDWFTFNGYMDYLLQPQLPVWLDKVKLDIAADVGTSRAVRGLGSVGYGCRDWSGLKIQDTPTEEEWIRFVKDRGGYIFRPVFSGECDSYHYDGYIAIEGNKKQVDNEDVPFVLQTGFIREEAPAAMVLFSPKGRKWSREAMWEAIMARREVGVLPQGKMLGPKLFRNALQMLLLDRVYLENYFGDAVQIHAQVDGRTLRIQLANVRETPIAGTLTVAAAPELELTDQPSLSVSLPARSTREFSLAIRPSLEAMGQANPVLASFTWGGWQKRTLAVMDLPPAISLHKLLYGQSPEVTFPVAVHNFGDVKSFPVRIRVVDQAAPSRVALDRTQTCNIPPGEYGEIPFKLPLKPGSYVIKVEALGATVESQIGIEAAEGHATVVPIDLDGDSVPEYRMENDKVRITLLAVGARVIEYFVKEKNDNILFKLWPEKELSTDRRPFRERGFYPYGGFEDFLGQASIETHKVYDAEITRKEGPFVQVRMTADYYGNRLEKTFTLYGNSPLVEVRFALNFRDPELNMIGPQPILELGRRHWTEDAFFVPTASGLREFHMRPEEYFGEALFLKEGWNAGRDAVEDVSFVGAFPVSEPEFLHMWMNHPSNGESNHYYAEFQPWVPIFHKNVRYFSYYLWGSAGPWETGVAELRRRNLITSR